MIFLYNPGYTDVHTGYFPHCLTLGSRFFRIFNPHIGWVVFRMFWVISVRNYLKCTAYLCYPSNEEDNVIISEPSYITDLKFPNETSVTFPLPLPLLDNSTRWMLLGGSVEQVTVSFGCEVGSRLHREYWISKFGYNTISKINPHSNFSENIPFQKCS